MLVQVYTQFRRWQEVDVATRVIQRVGRGYNGRQRYNRFRAAKEAEEMKARKKAARVRGVRLQRRCCPDNEESRMVSRTPRSAGAKHAPRSRSSELHEGSERAPT